MNTDVVIDIGELDDIFTLLCENNLWIIENENTEKCIVCNITLDKNDRYEHIDSPKHLFNCLKYIDKIYESNPELIYTHENCNICFDKIDNGTQLKCCDKYFHTKCLVKWRKINNSCPMCRYKNPLFIRTIYKPPGIIYNIYNSIIKYFI